MEERLQKILSRAGLGSRRACDQFIEEGKVRVNGKIAILGTKADAEKDTITLDGNPIPKSEPLVYIALHKPRSVLSDASEKENDSRKKVRDLVPYPGHLFIVGRLDYDSEGLILLTNDGEMANRLMHPRYGHEKEYRVRVSSKPDEEQLAIWRRGVVLEDGHRTLPAKVAIESETPRGIWLRVILREGRKRQIREVATRIGLFVKRLIRLRIESLELGALKPGEWRYLTAREIARLQQISSKSEAKKATSRTRTDTKKPVARVNTKKPNARPALKKTVHKTRR